MNTKQKTFVLRGPEQLRNCLKYLTEEVSLPDERRKSPYEVIIRPHRKRRNILMNSCLHLYCTLLALELNNAGYDFKKFLEVSEYKLDVPWTPESVKEHLWRPVQITLTGKKSTTEPTDFEYCQIYQTLSERISDLTGIFVDWPHEEKAA
jgi:hypothetical protein